MTFPFEQVLVVGGTGQTGHRIIEFLIQQDSAKIVATSRAVDNGLPAGPLASTILGDARQWSSKVVWRPLDLEAEPEVVGVQLSEIGAQMSKRVSTALIFAAAFTNVEVCETDPMRCERINETNTVSVLQWAINQFDAKLVFYSTDYVFDGGAGPYREDASRNAESRYGQAKLFVEDWLLRHAQSSLILRTTGVYDYLPGSKNFLMQMLELWGQKKITRIPSDQYSNPVWARELAKATLELLIGRASGIYHVAGATYLSRTEFAKSIARIFGFDPQLIESVRTQELKQKARRPLRGGLLCEKLKNELNWVPSSVSEVLGQLLKKYQNK